MLASFNDVWRRYKWSPELWARFSKGGDVYDTPDPVLQRFLLAAPIARTLSLYTGYGLSPVALAAITRQKPSDVVTQTIRENFCVITWCSNTRLPVIDRWTPYKMPTVDYRIEGLKKETDRFNYISTCLEEDFFHWLARQDQKKWSTHFHRINVHHKVGPWERRRMREANTLGFSLQEAEPFLLTEEEAREVYAISGPKSPPLRPSPPPPRPLTIRDYGYMGNNTY